MKLTDFCTVLNLLRIVFSHSSWLVVCYLLGTCLWRVCIQTGHSAWWERGTEGGTAEHSAGQGRRHQTVHGHDRRNKDCFYTRNTASPKEHSSVLTVIQLPVVTANEIAQYFSHLVITHRFCCLQTYLLCVIVLRMHSLIYLLCGNNYFQQKKFYLRGGWGTLPQLKFFQTSGIFWNESN